MVEKEQQILDELSSSLEKKLAVWAHPGITAQVCWEQDTEKSVRIDEPLAHLRVGERGFTGSLARFGHGLQRSYMLALLQELTSVSDDTVPTLIMGIEEPEIYQHPPQAKHLKDTLIKLSEQGSQVMVCSHSPLFVSGDHFEKIRLIRGKGSPSKSYVTSVSYEDLAKKLKECGDGIFTEGGVLAKLYPVLNPVINEMFFCKHLILVEGMEDVAYITTCLQLSGKMEAFKQYQCHLVPVGGKSMLIKPLTAAKLLDIPVFVVCDADADKKTESEVERHEKDNGAILALLGYTNEPKLPSSTIIKEDLRMWSTNLTDVVKKDLGEDWEKFRNKARQHYGNPGSIEKNPMAIAKALSLAWDDNLKSQALLDLVDDILTFAEKTDW